MARVPIPSYDEPLASPGATNTNWFKFWQGLDSGSREVLTENGNLYVRADGNDANPGNANTANGAFLTIQHAINVAAAKDLSTFLITINIGAGTFTEDLDLKSYIGDGPIILSGAGATTIIEGTSSPTVNASDVIGPYTLVNLKLTHTGGNHAINLSGGTSQISSSGIEFGACQRHVSCTYHARYFSEGAVTVSGAFNIHHYVDNCGIIQEAGKTITISGTPAMSQTWAFSLSQGTITANGNTYSGSVSGGVKFYVDTGALISVNGAGLNYFPGAGAGTQVTAQGGFYI